MVVNGGDLAKEQAIDQNMPDQHFAFLAEHGAQAEARWNFVRTFRTDDEELTRRLQRAHVNDGKGVYDQDHVVLEAQQRAILKNPRLPFYNLNIDAGALWARRMIDRRLAKEQGAGSAPRPRNRARHGRDTGLARGRGALDAGPHVRHPSD